MSLFLSDTSNTIISVPPEFIQHSVLLQTSLRWKTEGKSTSASAPLATPFDASIINLIFSLHENGKDNWPAPGNPQHIQVMCLLDYLQCHSLLDSHIEEIKHRNLKDAITILEDLPGHIYATEEWSARMKTLVNHNIADVRKESREKARLLADAKYRPLHPADYFYAFQGPTGQQINEFDDFEDYESGVPCDFDAA